METALRLGMERPFRIETPLMRLTKAETWALAKELGGAALVDSILEESHTCYLGERGVRHDWGYGCGDCPACELRAKGWREWTRRRLRAMSYAVKEIFLTLQGEGGQAGRAGGVLPLRRLQPVDRARAGPGRRRLHLLRHRLRRHWTGRAAASFPTPRPWRRRWRRLARRPGRRGWWSAPAASRCCSSTPP